MRKAAADRSRKSHPKALLFESLEPRQLLSGEGLVPVGQQPDGGLSGKVVYVHGGHGYTANNLGSGAWSTQRPLLFSMVEDLGNQDQMTMLADNLFRAGATVVPLRPVGYQRNEVVLDNTSASVTFVGSWSDSSSSIYYGAAGAVPFRFASTSPTETAYARYRPNIPAAGFYPVYAWAVAGSNRASDHLYRVAHSGGITEVRVNHQMVGSGLVYLGTYYFRQGTAGYVDVSNRSNDAGKVVVADMIRFGNGMGDINRGGGVSGQPREDEAGLYWVKWHVDRSQGIPESTYRASTDDGTATVSLSPRYAAYMNNASVGTLSDRAFVSFHSNAATGTSRGVLGLYNGNNTPSSATPNQFLIADTLAREINNDLVAQNGTFEHDWFNRTTLTLDRSDIEFGEINNTYINGEFDATIMETGFHDNQQDAEMLRDPRVRAALARATYQGLVKYFRAVDGNQTPLVMLPGTPTNVRAESLGSGEVRLTWTPPVANSHAGDAATGYRIYASFDGYGFDGGTYVGGGSTTSFTFTGLDPAEGTHYFRIVAENTGGQSAPSEVLAAAPTGNAARVLIVNGFDRLERRLNPREPYGGNQVERTKPRQSNSFDYAVQAGEAIEASDAGIRIDTTSNEPVATGLISLANYDAVIWMSGEESSANRTFDAQEQPAMQAYLNGGGNLFVSGAEIGWDLDSLNNGRTFYRNDLRSQFALDDANTYNVGSAANGIFAGLSFSFDNGNLFYNVDFPDAITPLGGALTALTYSGGSGGTAAIQFDGGPGQAQVVNFGFPFETITTAARRADVMARVLDFFGTSAAVEGDFSGDGVLDCADIGQLTREIASGGSNLLFDLTGDTLVNLEDVDRWVVTLYGSRFGDANLDRVVDGSDFGIWNASKFTTGGEWCTGDFNADGIVDGSDFGIWNSNKFQSGALRPSVTGPAPVGSAPDSKAAAGMTGREFMLPGAPAVSRSTDAVFARWSRALEDDEEEREE